MTLSPELAAIRDEAMAISCEGWAIQKRWTLAPGIDRAGPCPVCGGKDRFAIHTKKNTFNCRRCGISGAGVIDLVMRTDNVDFVKACEIITGRRAAGPVDEKRRDALRRKAEADAKRRAAEAERYRERARREAHDTWVSTWVPGHGGPVEAYLRLRGIDLDALPVEVRTQVCRVLHEYDALPWTEGRQGEDGRVTLHTLHHGPAMVARIVLPAHRVAADDPLRTFGGTHQTWIDLKQRKGRLLLPDTDAGKKRPTKKVRGRKQGGMIPLYTPSGPLRIVMGEGIETTLTALAHAFEPATAYWAGVDLGNMAGRAARDGNGRILHDVPDLDDRECFIPPAWCAELVYLAEDDGEESHSLDKAWRGLRRAEALVPGLTGFYVPPVEGGDLNDLVRPPPTGDADEGGGA